jgi:hypothetical protein
MACSSKESSSTPATKTDSGVDIGGGTKTPASKTTTTPTTSATTKPTSKPTTTTTAPPTTPPEMPPSTPDLVDPTQLDAEEAFTLEVSCAKAGLTEGKGYCLEGGSYLLGCVGGKLKGLDCAIYDTADFAADCFDAPKAGCFGVTLSPVASDVLDDAPAFGSDSGDTCPAVQEGRGFCSDAFVTMCAGGKVYSIDCASYGTAGATCKSSSDGALSCF